VSLVFRNAPGASQETRERVLRAADELGYRPDSAARLLRRTRSRHIGVLFTMQQPYDVDLVDAMYPAAEHLGYHIVLGAMLPTRDERKAAEDLLDYRSEGLILIGPESDSPSLAGLIENLPVVEIGRRLRGDRFDVYGSPTTVAASGRRSSRRPGTPTDRARGRRFVAGSRRSAPRLSQRDAEARTAGADQGDPGRLHRGVRS
jgi:DNA-binding LacI/PurR family transcriptional regulator